MREKDLNGKKAAREIKKRIKERIDRHRESTGVVPKLVMVQVGEDLSAAAYVRSKQRMCKKLGVESELVALSESTSLKKLSKTINELNHDPSVNGIILELPLPQHVPYNQAVSLIDPIKDVDGLHPANLGLLFSGQPRFVPNTPMGVMRLLEHYQVKLEGKNVTIVGRSLAVGKPLFCLMLAKNATATICHSRTRNLKEHCLDADVLVVAVGKAGVITGDYVRDGAVVVDVGINVTDQGLVGDVDYEGAYDKASLITPVPGGVGPLTVAMIIENTLKAAIYQKERKAWDNSLHVVG